MEIKTILSAAGHEEDDLIKDSEENAEKNPHDHGTSPTRKVALAIIGIIILTIIFALLMSKGKFP